MSAATALAGQPEPRARILECALALMSEHGVHATGMRRLAGVCGLNVATIYHYYPSKADLVRAVIADQSYDELLARTPPIDGSLPLRPRLEALLGWVLAEISAQEPMWRLLLGESLRGDDDVLAAAAELSAAFEDAIVRWLGELFPDLPGDRSVLARLIRTVGYGFVVEGLPASEEEPEAGLRRRATELAAVIVPDG